MTESTRRIRVLIAKAGLDGHDRGARVVAASLRDAGMEVIYTGLRQTPEAIVAAAMQEDVDAIGLSSLSGAHLSLFERILELLKEQGLQIMVFGGGVIPNADLVKLEAIGVAKIFGPGTDTNQISAWLGDTVAARRAAHEVNDD